MCFCSHLSFDVFRILSLAVSFLVGLPGILCLFQVHIFFHRDCDNLPRLSSLARLRSSWSNIQQLGQEYSLLYLQSVLKICCLCCASQFKSDDHTEHFLHTKMDIKHSIWCDLSGGEEEDNLRIPSVQYFPLLQFLTPKS